MNLRQAETNSIMRFLTDHADKLRGQVLDLGCGQQRYKSIVESFGGTYTGYDRPSFGGSVVTEDVGDPLVLGREYDTVMMTQVWQYIPWSWLSDMLRFIASGEGFLKPGGWLLATGPTNWPVVEKDDLHRLTCSGVVRLLDEAGFPLCEVLPRHAIEHGGEKWSCGWAAAARSSE